METGGARKRDRLLPPVDSDSDSDPSLKKSRPESETLQHGVRSKSKPCTKFFSTSGCPYGEECHFLHNIPGGYKTISQTMILTPPMPVPTWNSAPPLPFLNGSSAKQPNMCKWYSSLEGCKFGDKCRFTHPDSVLGQQPPYFPPPEDPLSNIMRAPPAPPGGFDFGSAATTKISIDASLAGAVIGRNGANSKQISRVTGVKFAIRDHESDTNLRNIEVEGSFDQIQQATLMVRELIEKVKVARSKNSSGPGGGANLKTKLCERFAKGVCNFGERCCFAHGPEELRKPPN